MQQLSYHPLTATNTAHALQEWLLPHHTVFAHLTETVSPFFSTTCPASEDKNEEEEEEEGKEKWKEKGEEEFWNHHPALTPVLSIPCDLIHHYSLYQVWEAKGSFKATASGRRSIALELSLLNTEALIHIAPQPWYLPISANKQSGSRSKITTILPYL